MNESVQSSQFYHQVFVGVLTTLLQVYMATTETVAQIAPDGSLGAESSIVVPNVSINNKLSDRIDGGAIRGNNLFHSFNTFNIGVGRGAYFTNPAGVQTIFSRVTGANRSEVFGTLGILGDANLFLSNPKGILFGPGANLDIRGSFIGTTADSIRFSDGSQFSSMQPQETSILTVSIPIGLQFGTDAPGSILAQQAQLSVQAGKTLALVGGDITLDSTFLSAAGGQIRIGSVNGTGVVSLAPKNNGFALEYGGLQSSQDSITSRAGQLQDPVTPKTGQLNVLTGSSITVSTFEEESTGELSVRAFEGINISGSGTALLARVSGIRGSGGNIDLESKRITVRDGATVSATTFGTGKAGDVNIRAAELLELTNGSLFARVDSAATGSGGNLTISTNKLTMSNEAQINVSTSGIGNAGNLMILAPKGSVEVTGSAPQRASILARVDSGATGAGGNITIETNTLSLKQGARISASSFGSGNAGSVTILAPSGSIEFVGVDSNRNLSGVFAQVVAGSVGSGGDVIIETDRLDLNQGVINISNNGRGITGNIRVNANRASLSRGFILADSATGKGGNITLDIRDQLFLRKGSGISTTAGTVGTLGDGGNININAGFIISVDRENNDIRSNAYTGNGGRVTVKAQEIFGIRQRDRPTNRSDITVRSEQGGVDGNIIIERPDFDPSRGLVELPKDVVDPTRLVTDRCATGRRRAPSRFVISGQGSLSVNPLDALSELQAVEDSGEIIEAQGWKRYPNGRLQFTSQRPMAQPYSSWLTPKPCPKQQ